MANVNIYGTDNNKVCITASIPVGTYKLSVDITSGSGVSKKYTVYAATQSGVEKITGKYERSLFDNYKGNYTLKLTAYNKKNVKIGSVKQVTKYIN